MFSIKYFFSEGFKSLRNNIGTTLGSIITICLSLFLIGLFMVGNQIVNNVTGAVEDQVSVTAYLSDDTANNEELLDQLQTTFAGIDGVEGVSYTSKEQAMEDFKATMKDEEIFAQLEGNPLPASFVLTLADPQKVDEIAATIAANETFIEACDNPEDVSASVKYGQKTVERLFGMTDVIRIVAALLVIMLIFVSCVFMNNNIRLSVLNRRKEISIERLVGASNGFIRGPFLAEGFIHAVIGAVIAIIALMCIQFIAIPALAANLAWLPLELGAGTYATIYIILLLIGIVIGLGSSVLAMNKYLKV